MSTSRQTIATVETLHSCYCLAATQHGGLAAARPAGSRTAQIFSDCAITKYFSRATAFTVNTWTHPGGRAITANYCHFACSGYAARDSLCRCRRRHRRHWRWRRLRVVRIDFVWGVIIAIKICHDTTSVSRYSIRYIVPSLSKSALLSKNFC